MARTTTRHPEERIPYQLQFRGRALDWIEKTAARHDMSAEEFTRELFAIGSQYWQKAHPEDIDPAAQRA